MSAAWRGRLFGLTISSELSLPFPVDATPSPGEPDVEVSFGPVVAVDRRVARCGDNCLQFEGRGAGRFRVEDGRRIIIDATVGASHRNLRVYLLGSAFGILLHQRGLLPLHANAILIGGRAVAFIGRSGAGKSTLAAWFHGRGHGLLADDVCAISFDAKGRPLVQPGVPRLRLWKDALERADHDVDRLERSFDGVDKFDFPAHRSAPLNAAPLAACFWLDEPALAAPMVIEPLAGAKAAEILIANTYRGRFSTLLGRAAPHMQACAQLARTTPLYRVARAKDADQFDAVALELEGRALALAAAH